MKHLVAVFLCGLVAACSVSTHTTEQRPAPPPTTVVTAPPPPTTVVVPAD